VKKPFTLNAAQLELLRDFTNFPVLQIFSEPHNPSDVAKSLNMPANSMHYRVNKLYEAGLLKLVEQKGRRRTYQSVATQFRVHRDLVQSLNHAGVYTVDALQKVSKGYQAALEECLDNTSKDSDTPDYIHFGVDDEGERVMSAYEPCLGLFDIPLSKEQYERLTKALLDITYEVKNDKTKKTQALYCCDCCLCKKQRISNFILS
jgi:DNA-binding transcriptional ArsR family regulator